MKNVQKEQYKPISSKEIQEYLAKMKTSQENKKVSFNRRGGSKYPKSLMRNIYQSSEQLLSEKSETQIQRSQNNSFKLPLLPALKFQKTPLQVKQKEGLQEQFLLKQSTHKSKEKEYGLTEDEKKLYGDRIVGAYQKLELLGKYNCISYKIKRRFCTRLVVKIAIKQIAKTNINESSMIRREIRFFKHFFSKEIKDLTFEEGYSNLIEILSVEQGSKDIWIVQELGGQPLSKSLYSLKGEFFKGERVYAITDSELMKEFLQRPQLFIKILDQTLKGIILMYTEGFTHSDLKPENILVEYNESQIKSVKIIDYGSSFLLTDEDNMGMVTPEYMAPEVLEILHNWGKLQLVFSSQIGALRANCEKSLVDVWSFGAIILDMIIGIPHWLNYKGKIERNGRQIVKIGLFASKGRELDKLHFFFINQFRIMLKQVQLIKQIEGIVEENATFLNPFKRKQLSQMLKKIFQIDPQLRINPIKLIEDEFFVI